MPTTGPCFLYGNHSHYMDPFFINVWMQDEPTAGVMTREQFHKPVSALFMDSIGIVPTTKYVPEPGVIRAVMKMADQRRMIVIFPEGGRRWDGRPKLLIESTLKLFYKMNLPVHPVQLHGSYVNWPRWADYPRFGQVEVHFMPVLIPDRFADYETFATICKKAIRFDEYHDVPEQCIPKWAYKPASGIHRLLYRCPESGLDNAIHSPDGHQIVSSVTGTRYNMLANSRLLNTGGEIVSLLDLFDTMKQLPMIKHNEGFLLQESVTPLFRLTSEYELLYNGDYNIRLYDDAIIVRNSFTNMTFKLDDLLYISIEQNHKLSLTFQSGTWQFYIRNGSALQWQHFLRRLKLGEQSVNSF
ncbi:MAG: 1-acyl-sn-glycerol-3-phosphate acyltransferase [Bacteroidetes bacterium]|nr:1-acyl-sn-glycerol-3-phosphate acyltransferase [Bacteroidota bacterium]